MDLPGVRSGGGRVKQVEVRKLPYFKAVHISWGNDETALKLVKQQLYETMSRCRAHTSARRRAMES